MKDINLVINSGEKIAFAGENGSGKTTLVKLLLRLYDVSLGEILLNGINIKEFQYEEYLRLFAPVFQDYQLHAYSLRENIAFLDQDRDERIWELLAENQMDGVIRDCPKGLDTYVTKLLDEEGRDFSGGEKQKLAMVRAQYKDADIFVLDEPTSAIDPIAEMEFFERVNDMTKNNTVVYVSHRMASTKFADQIFVLKDGELIEHGNYHALMEQNGVYAEMFKLQSSYYNEDPQNENPITVEITQREFEQLTAEKTCVSYEFEKSIYEINGEELDSTYWSKVAENLNNPTVRTVSIYENDFALLNQFARITEEVYFTEEMPDFSMIYDLSNDARKENMMLIQAWGYMRGIGKDNEVLSCDSEVKVIDVENVDDASRKITFFLRQNLKVNSEISDRASGNYVVANIVDTIDGPKMINVWIDGSTMQLMRKRIQNKLHLRGNANAIDTLEKELFEEVARRKAEILSTEAWIDPDDSVDDIEIEPRARVTVAYDRNTVAEMAVAYAFGYNPRFYVAYDSGVEKDCTNFVSQSMWQSPRWPFDNIGVNKAVQWYCTKDTAGQFEGKYVGRTPSWAGVDALYEYFKSNDNLSLAGTVYGISANTSSYNISNVQVGDIIQFAEGSDWHHSVVVSAIESGTRNTSKVLCAAHSDSQINKSVAEYMSDGFSAYRVIHINNFITSY